MSVSRKFYGMIYADTDACNLFKLFYGMSIWDFAEFDEKIEVHHIEMGMARIDIALTDIPPGVEFLEAWAYEALERECRIYGRWCELSLEDEPWMGTFLVLSDERRVVFSQLSFDGGILMRPLERNPRWPVPLDTMQKERIPPEETHRVSFRRGASAPEVTSDTSGEED